MSFTASDVLAQDMECGRRCGSADLHSLGVLHVYRPGNERYSGNTATSITARLKTGKTVELSFSHSTELFRFRYIEEYGFPSTHAMFAAGIPLSLVLLSFQRYDVSHHEHTGKYPSFTSVQFMVRAHLRRCRLSLGVSQSHLSWHAFVPGESLTNPSVLPPAVLRGVCCCSAGICEGK